MRKINLLKLDITVIRDTFTTHSAGIYSKRMSVLLTERDNSPVTLIAGATWDEDLPEELLVIGSLRVNETRYVKLDSIADLYILDEAFYYNYDNQTLYVSLTDYRKTLPSDVYKTGETFGLISEAQLKEINGVKYPIDAQLGETPLEPRLQDISVSETVDDQENGIFVFDELSASFANADGEFDNLRRDVTGNNAQLFIADLSQSPEEEIETGFPYKDAADEDDFKLVQQGVIEDILYSDPDSPEIKAVDPRSDWTQKISTNLLTVTEFPNLPDKYIDARKQLCIGQVNGIPCIPLRDNATAADFDYHICDTAYGDIQSITAVYFDGQLDTGSGKTDVARYLTSGEYSVDLTTGVITIEDCIKGKVWVYGTFTTMSESVEIITFLLDEFAGLPFIDTFYNLDEIQDIQDAGYTTHVFIITKGKELFKVIEQLVLEIQVDFFQQEGIYTMRFSNELRAVTEEIETYEFISTPPAWDNTREKTIKTIEVLYNKDYREDLTDRYYDASKESEALLNNRRAEDKTFEVNLNNQVHVELIYDQYYSRFIKLPRTVTVNRTIPFTAGLTDFISFPVVRKTIDNEKEIFPDALYKIVSINRVENTVDVAYFEDSPVEPVFVAGVQFTPDGFRQITPWSETTSFDQLTTTGEKQKTTATDQQQLPYVIGGEVQLFIEKE